MVRTHLDGDRHLRTTRTFDLRLSLRRRRQPLSQSARSISNSDSQYVLTGLRAASAAHQRTLHKFLAASALRVRERLRNIDMPMIVGRQRLLETRPLERSFGIAFEQASLAQNPIHGARATSHHVGIEHHIRQTPITFQRMVEVVLDDRLLLRLCCSLASSFCSLAAWASSRRLALAKLVLRSKATAPFSKSCFCQL